MNKLALILLLSGTAHAVQPLTLATINGTAIKRAEAMNRAWRQYGPQIINEMTGEILIRQAAAEAKISPDTAAVDARLKSVRDQFPDEKTFKERLKVSGINQAELRRSIEDQILRETMTIKSKNITVTEDELKTLFAANKERLGVPEAVRLRYLAVTSEKEAADFVVAVKAGADFSKLASQVSIDNTSKTQGGEIGFVPRGQLTAAIEAVVFALKPGEVSAPVKAPFGWQVFKVEERRPSKEAVYEEVRSALGQQALVDKVAKASPVYLQELRAKAKIVPGK